MATELIINASLPETRISLMENGEIQELLIERASGKGIVGNIYKGRVTRVLPGMQAAFVDIGLEKAAFLYVDDVYVHSEIWEEEESASEGAIAAIQAVETETSIETAAPQVEAIGESPEESAPVVPVVVEGDLEPVAELASSEGEVTFHDEVEHDEHDEEDEEGDDDHGPVGMGPGPDDDEQSTSGDSHPEGTLAPPVPESESRENREEQFADEMDASSDEGAEGSSEDEPGEDSGEVTSEGGASSESGRDGGRRRRHRRGRRGGRFRNRRGGENQQQQSVVQQDEQLTESLSQQVDEQLEERETDRSSMSEAELGPAVESGMTERPEMPVEGGTTERRLPKINPNDFNSQRSRDRRIKPRASTRSVRTQVNIQDLLKEGQEVLVQVAKDPIATKGARLTCHISLPGRHLVCMPTIDHVGVSRRIERDDERRRLRELVERSRPKNLGFIVRTASGRGQSEKRIKQDIDYLTRLWSEIREKAANVTAPALVYEDLNAVLRAIRDWVTEDINKIIVDSRYHFNEILRFVSHFMPAIRHKVELYHGDIPIFDAYNISTELSRALERKVWLKSGGYIVIDQAEALVAIDVNTGRYVGKKNLEDTIFKTNLEAVQEIAYQLRLRNCGGIIILDLIDMEKEENKQRVYRALEEALKKDRARPTILKISELGLIEMTRKRTRDTIVRSLCESCSHCEGKGFIKSKQTVAYEVLREIEREGIEQDINKILVQAHADVIDLLAIDERESLDQLERRYRKQIYLQAVTDFHPEQFEVIGDKKVKTERGVTPLSPKTQAETPSRERESGGRDRNRDRGRGRDRDRDRNRDRDRDRSRGGSPQVVPQPIEPVVRESSLVQLDAAPQEALVQESQVQEMNEGLLPKVEAKLGEDQFDEEDRLAFLRAQAAQDAALARLRNSSEPLLRAQGNGAQVKRSNGSGTGNPKANSGGGRNNNRRRRAGKFRGPKNFQGKGPVNPVAPLQEQQEVSAPQEPQVIQDEGSGSNDSGSTPAGDFR